MKALGAVAVISVLALSVASISTPASARNGGAVAAGVIGGLAAGAIIGSAAANRSYYSGPAYVEGPAYVVGPRCYTQRREVVDPYGNIRIRRVRVCD